MIVFQHPPRSQHLDNIALTESFLDHMLHGVDSDPILFMFDKSSDGVQRVRLVGHRAILAEFAGISRKARFQPHEYVLSTRIKWTS